MKTIIMLLIIILLIVSTIVFYNQAYVTAYDLDYLNALETSGYQYATFSAG